MTRRSDPTLASMTAHYNGRRYSLHRVRLDDLHDWLQARHLRVDRATRGLTNDWPVLICERRPDAPPADRP